MAPTLLASSSLPVLSFINQVTGSWFGEGLRGERGGGAGRGGAVNVESAHIVHFIRPKKPKHRGDKLTFFRCVRTAADLRKGPESAHTEW